MPPCISVVLCLVVEATAALRPGYYRDGRGYPAGRDAGYREGGAAVRGLMPAYGDSPLSQFEEFEREMTTPTRRHPMNRGAGAQRVSSVVSY